MINSIDSYINEALEHSIDIKRATVGKYKKDIIKCVDLIVRTVNSGNKILVCGNGGSAADSLHICAEFTNRLLKERRPLPAFPLSSDVASITAISNDYSYELIFSKQVEAFGKRGDLLWILTTSGKSKNLLNAAEKAKEIGMNVLSFSGKNGGDICPLSDIILIVEKGQTSPRIQETHVFLYHIIIELVEEKLFGEFR